MLKQKILINVKELFSSKHQTEAFSQHFHLVLLQNGLKDIL